MGKQELPKLNRALGTAFEGGIAELQTQELLKDRKIWEHLLWFALVVPSMYYIKYKNKTDCKEISTAQDSGGIK